MWEWDLTPKHVAALEWIRNGCPTIPEVLSYQRHAFLLERRGLISVERQPWSAQLTPSGLSLLDWLPRGPRLADDAGDSDLMLSDGHCGRVLLAPGEPPHAVVAAAVLEARRRGRVVPRRLFVLHAIAKALENRGFSVAAEGAGVVVQSGDELAIGLDVVDQTDRVVRSGMNGEPEMDRQRQPIVDVVANGSVAVLVGPPRHPFHRWFDRAQWTIADKIPEIVQSFEDQVAQDRAARNRADQAKRDLREQWELAVKQARANYAQDGHRRRADRQARAWVDAGRLRGLAAAVRQRAETLSEKQRGRAMEWAQYLDHEAERIDPLNHPKRLAKRRPNLNSDAVDYYMPGNWTIRRPPR